MQTLKLTKKYETYPEYKDSGVEWLGKIPKDWKENKLKRLFDFQSGDGFPDNVQGGKTGDVPFMKVSDINGEDRYVTSANNYVDLKDVREKSWHLIPSGSILMSKIGAALGKNHRKINTIPVCIDNNMLAATPKGIIPEYGFWIWKMLNMSDFENISSVPSVNLDMLRNHSFPVPDIKQQTIITDFLEEKTTCIDQIIYKKQMQIELLQEKRTAVINHAVTKGFDSKVECVESGIEWIGKIPKEWKLDKIKRISNILPSNIDKLSVEGELSVRLCNYTDVYNNQVIIKDMVENLMLATATEKQVKRLSLRKDDVIITKDSETPDDIGIPAYVPETLDGIVCGYHLAIIRPTKIYGAFLYYFFLTQAAKTQFFMVANGLTRYALGIGDIGTAILPIPIRKEQEKIVSYLDKKTCQYDEAINFVEKSINTLKEFKSSLISNVVTGKIKI